MAKYNPRRAKINRSYRLNEIAELYGIHKRTVTGWTREGLPLCSDQRPVLVDGKDLRHFLEARSLAAKRPCRPGQFYCVACKAVQYPDGNRAWLRMVTDTVGDLQGECPTCHRVLHRRVSAAKTSSWQGPLSVARVEDQARLNGRR